jgi:hypothetical protein
MSSRHSRSLSLPAMALGLSLALVSAGCPDRNVTAVDPKQSNEEVKEIDITVSRAVDILFVIDNSSSMEQEQASLARNFPRFIDKLQAIEGGLPDVHLGVVSSSLGAGGNDVTDCGGEGDEGNLLTNSCPGVNEAFLSDVLSEDGLRRVRNYDAPPGGLPEDQWLAETFGCMAELGTGGCGFEQHLEAMRRALDDNPRNAGFLRDDAFLAVIFIADEDDCSASNPAALFDSDPTKNTLTSELGPLDSFRCFEHGVVCDPDENRRLPADGGEVARQNCVPRDDSRYLNQVQGYVDFLKGRKSDPDKVLVAGILGDRGPVKLRIESKGSRRIPQVKFSCQSSNGEADPSVRLSAFLDGFPGSVQETICDADLSGALDAIAAQFIREFNQECIEGELVDFDPTVDGVQPDCRLSEILHKGKPNQEESSIKPCAIAGAARPCYSLAPDEDRCTTSSHHLALEVDRGGAEPPPDASLVFRCAVE